MSFIELEEPKEVKKASFNQVASPDAPAYEPETWNDLSENFQRNEELFFEALSKQYYRVATTLNMAGLSDLFHLRSLVDECDYTARYAKKPKIVDLIGPEDAQKIAGLLQVYFSAQQTRANCYAYAINFRDGYAGAKPDPGMKSMEYFHGLYDKYEQALTEGSELDGLEFAGTTMPPVKEGHYRAALFMLGGLKKSFHWMRENKPAPGSNEMTWSGKDSHSPATNLDYEGKVVTNPEKAAMGTLKFYGYFYVPKEGVTPVQFRKDKVESYTF